jgi:hypothetical protein
MKKTAYANFWWLTRNRALWTEEKNSAQGKFFSFLSWLGFASFRSMVHAGKSTESEY